MCLRNDIRDLLTKDGVSEQPAELWNPTDTEEETRVRVFGRVCNKVVRVVLVYVEACNGSPSLDGALRVVCAEARRAV